MSDESKNACGPCCGPECNCPANGRTPREGECCCGPECRCEPNCGCPPECRCPRR
ncbi:MAG: hypothetical protein KF729_03000 [Sandaracinaceae bacterium]|nr:hypothetical protein [Sandaracinaceae bacterium]